MSSYRPLRASMAALALAVLAVSCGDSRPPLEPVLTHDRGASPKLIGSLVGAIDAVLYHVVGVDGGTVIIETHSLDFPAGALTEETTIEAKLYDGSPRVRFGPQGLEFPAGSEPVLTLTYAGVLPSDVDPQRLVVVYLDPAGEVVEVLPTEVDEAAGVARARLRHFSTYALATD